MHPTIGPNATQAGAIALYNLIQDAVYFAPESAQMHTGIAVDHMRDIDTARGVASIFTCDGREYIVTIMPMPGARSAVDDYPPCPDCGYTADDTTPCLCPPRPRGGVPDTLPF
jgi:hypothetical protein